MRRTDCAAIKARQESYKTGKTVRGHCSRVSNSHQRELDGFRYAIARFAKKMGQSDMEGLHRAIGVAADQFVDRCNDKGLL